MRPCWGGIAADRPPLGRARGGGLVAQGRGGRCVVSFDAFYKTVGADALRTRWKLIGMGRRMCGKVRGGSSLKVQD